MIPPEAENLYSNTKLQSSFVGFSYKLYYSRNQSCRTKKIELLDSADCSRSLHPLLLATPHLLRLLVSHSTSSADQTRWCFVLASFDSLRACFVSPLSHLLLLFLQHLQSHKSQE